MKRIIVGLVAVFAFGVPDKVTAETIKLTFSGAITTVSDPTGGRFTDGILPGTAFTVTVSYDPTATPASAASNVQMYPYLSSSLTIGTRTFEPPTPYIVGSESVMMIYHSEQTDGIQVHGRLDGNQYEGGSYYSVSLSDRTQSTFTSSKLPRSLSLEHFQGAGLVLALKPIGEDQTPFASAAGTITAVSVTSIPTAPEPSSLFLLASAGTGLVGMAWRRSRRRSTIR